MSLIASRGGSHHGGLLDGQLSVASDSLPMPIYGELWMLSRETAQKNTFSLPKSKDTPLHKMF
eukprot:897063-Karenia_brevis.AAC.1